MVQSCTGVPLASSFPDDNVAAAALWSLCSRFEWLGVLKVLTGATLVSLSLAALLVLSLVLQ